MALTNAQVFGSIFCQPWWLDAVAPDRWDAAQVFDRGELQARMPYVLQRNRLGFRIISMPPLTQALGPWIVPREAKYTNQIARQHTLKLVITINCITNAANRAKFIFDFQF